MKLYIQESYDNFTVGEFKQCVTDIYHKYFPNSYIEIKLGTTSSGVIRTSCLKVKCYLDNYANNDDLFNVIFDVWGMRGFHDYDEITEKIFLNVVNASFKTDKYFNSLTNLGKTLLLLNNTYNKLAIILI